MKFPVIFISGILAPTNALAWSYFNGIRHLAAAAGIEAHFIPLPAWGCIEERAALIKNYLDQNLKTDKAHFICHSKGGIDLRFLLNRDISASFALRPIRWLGRWGFRFKQTLEELDSAFLADLWLKDRPEVKNIPRFYVAAHQPLHWSRFLYPLFAYLGRKIQIHEGDNDGFVSVHSATWGEKMALVKTNHIGLIGHMYGLTWGFNHRTLYLEIFDRLKKVELNG
jgi:hypothetical protein